MAGITTSPDGRWVTQQARNVLMRLDEEEVRLRFLVRDRDSKFTRDFDEVFRSEGIRVIKAPVRAPQARAYAERWVGSVRRECLDRLLILGRRDLQHVLGAHVRHLNEHRPHRALGQRPPLSDEQELAEVNDIDRLRRRDVLGGLIHEYQLAAPTERAPYARRVSYRRLLAQASITARDPPTRAPRRDHSLGAGTPSRTG